jgi:circadian clock protein KaiC
MRFSFAQNLVCSRACGVKISSVQAMSFCTWRSNVEKRKPGLAKCLTGIQGLDEITMGGLPKGRPTLVCGGPGCGKTLFAMEFLVHGAVHFHEPGVFMAFEEIGTELVQNVASLGFDLENLIRQKKMIVDYVRLERAEIIKTGKYDLEGLFIRLGYAIDSLGAKRVVLDTLEALFAGLSDPALIRAELRRLFYWLKNKGVTAIITGERGKESLTRLGIEEYVSDCVISLDHRINQQIATRRLTILKYRGSPHGTNEYPFLIDETGLSVIPITSLGLNHNVSTQYISSGIPHLDTLLNGKGFYRASSILVSGTAGTGKTSMAIQLADSACRRGERVLYFSFEESPSQIIRNIRSIGTDLQPWVTQGLLKFHATRATLYGLETHLALMHKAVSEFKPRVVVIDQINSFVFGGNNFEVTAMLVRLIDFLKMHQITLFCTSLTNGGTALERTDAQVSSLIDSWILLRDFEIGHERERGLYILKSRGMAHSNQIVKYKITERGIELKAGFAPETCPTPIRKRLVSTSARRRRALESQIVALPVEQAMEKEEMLRMIQQDAALAEHRNHNHRKSNHRARIDEREMSR